MSELITKYILSKHVKVGDLFLPIKEYGRLMFRSIRKLVLEHETDPGIPRFSIAGSTTGVRMNANKFVLLTRHQLQDPSQPGMPPTEDYLNKIRVLGEGPILANLPLVSCSWVKSDIGDLSDLIILECGELNHDGGVDAPYFLDYWADIDDCKDSIRIAVGYPSSKQGFEFMRTFQTSRKFGLKKRLSTARL